MSLKNIFVLLIPVAVLVGCAFGEDSSNGNQRELTDLNKTLGEFQAIIGLYSGTVTNDGVTKKIELKLFNEPVLDSRNSDGEAVPRSVLKASVRSIDPVECSVNFVARFYKETSLIVLGKGSESSSSSNGASDSCSDSSSNASKDPFTSIIAKIDGDKITGEATRASGSAGIINLTRTSVQPNAPSNGEQNDLVERLRREYDKVAGTYVGPLKMADGSAGFDIELRMFVVNSSSVCGTSTNGTKVELCLRGFYKKAADNTQILDQNLAVTFKTDLNPAELYLISDGNRVSPYYVSIDAIVVPPAADGSIKTIRGSLKTQKGLQGYFEIQKVIKVETVEKK
ncbi:MAG: hypothetical protein ACOYOK_12315 [Pseudobdellovibrionaceae bacterium]